MIITFGGIKGGSGKTTLATNTACILSKNHSVLLVDADDQQTASDWVSQRESRDIETKWTTICLSGANVCHQLRKLKSQYDYIIIDTGGRDTSSQRAALLVCDIFITPFQPRSFDVWTMSKLNSLIEEAKIINESLKSFAIINRGDYTGQDNEATKEILGDSPLLKCIDMSIQQRKSFCNAAAEGLSVVELKKKDIKAISEIKKFIQWVKGMGNDGKRLQNKVKKTPSHDDFIHARTPKRKGSEVKVTLRIPEEMLSFIDDVRKSYEIKESRNTWILKAIKKYGKKK